MNEYGLLARLRAIGVERVEAHYDGYGDGGSMQEVELYGAGDAPIAGPDEELRQELETAVCDLLSRQWPGWEIDDGSFGTVTIKVNSGQVEVEHGMRYTEIDFDSYKGAL